MKAVILAGGKGTRLCEETQIKPKPMVEIGGKPILWHILKIYSEYGIDDFIICCGYKGYLIKEYFRNYLLHNSDMTISLKDNKLEIHSSKTENWNITLVDTGNETLTGGRLLRVKNYIGKETFALTYGDGLTDLNIKASLDFHNKNNKMITVTAVRPQGRFGALGIDSCSAVHSFYEKPEGKNSWINGGFFIIEPEALNYIKGDNCSWEEDCLPKIINDGNLNAFKHEGFWHPMDNLRDKNNLERLWSSKKAPWKAWY